jgi:hypothetical protein
MILLPSLPCREGYLGEKLTGMQIKNLEILHQFREPDLGLPRQNGQYGNVYFRHFCKAWKQEHPLERFVENWTTQSSLLSEITAKLEREDKTIIFRLNELVKKLQRVLALSFRRESYPSTFIARLLPEIDRFSDLEDLYRKKIQLPLLKSLRDVLTATPKGTGPYLGSRNIAYTRNAILSFLDDIYHYHDVFTELLEEEYVRKRSTASTTPAKEEMLKLTALIKSQIFAIEGTVKYLNQWGKKVHDVEAQRIYN